MSHSNLKELLAISDIELVLKRMVEIYPDETGADNLDGYRKVIGDLMEMEPEKEDDMQISVHLVNDDPEPWVDVSGVKPNDEQCWALEFRRWEQWAGMSFTKESHAAFPIVDLLAHALWEMTFCGFEQEPIQQQIQDIHGMVDKIKSGEIETKSFDSVDEMKEHIEKMSEEE